MNKPLINIWTISELFNGKPKDVSFELLTHARKISDKVKGVISSIILASRIKKKIALDHIKRGADRVYILESPLFENFIVENYSSVIVKLTLKYKPDIIIGPATSRGRILLPHIAAKLGVGLTADCTELDIDKKTGDLIQIRPAIGGNIMAKIITPGKRPQMATVRPKLLKPQKSDSSREGEIIELDCPHLLNPDKRIKCIGFKPHKKSEVDIQEADIIVSGGGGLKKAENFKMIRKLAEELRGAVGASRNAVDRGWISYPHQVGLSGKTVTPRIYFAVGISGAIQHLAGMKTSESIISINIDPDAQIFKVSDLGIIGDAFEIIPRLLEEIKDIKFKESIKFKNGR